MAHTLRSQSIVHEALEVPGYTMETDMARFDWQRWQKTGLDATRVAAGGIEKVVLGGLCMGGMMAASIVDRIPEHVAGLVLLSPTFAYDGWGLSPSRHLRHFAYWTGIDRFFSVSERTPFGVKNEKMRKWIERELNDNAASAAGPMRIPLRALREADRMMGEALLSLRKHDIPLLVIHAREDEITRLSSVQRIFDSLPTRNKQFVVLENSYHMISIDNDRRQVASTIARFVHSLSERNGMGEAPT